MKYTWQDIETATAAQEAIIKGHIATISAFTLENEKLKEQVDDLKFMLSNCRENTRDKSKF